MFAAPKRLLVFGARTFSTVITTSMVQVSNLSRDFRPLVFIIKQLYLGP
jgi:hypothetical protein